MDDKFVYLKSSGGLTDLVINLDDVSSIERHGTRIFIYTLSGREIIFSPDDIKRAMKELIIDMEKMRLRGAGHNIEK